MYFIIKYNSSLHEHSKELRNSQTRHENHLWFDFLKEYPVRIRRQKIIGNYIVDFYCAKAKLAIEIDGTQHFIGDGPEYDKARTEYIESQGVKVLRFSNYEIDHEFEGVCLKIHDEIETRMVKRNK